MGTRPAHAWGSGRSGPLVGARDGGVVMTERGGEGAHLPVLGVVEPQGKNRMAPRHANARPDDLLRQAQ